MSEFNQFNVRGRVTYSNFTMSAAHKANSNPKLQFPKKPEDVAPDFQLLLTQPQVERLVTAMIDAYLPEIVKRAAAGEKRNLMEKADADKVKAALEAGMEKGPEGWDVPPFLPLKNVYAKTLEVVPDAWATLKVGGQKGTDLGLLARVNDEDELLTPDDQVRVYPLLLPIGQTIHDLYPGSVAFSTIRLNAFKASKTNYGVTAYANQLVFIRDDERLGGGGDLDTDSVFLDDDE